MKLDKSIRRFILPDPGTFVPNGPDDPLPYYYKPLIGKIYCARIENALAMLSPPYNSCLEIGYGSGILLPSLHKMSESLTAIDLRSSPEQLKEPLSRLNVKCSLVKGDINDGLLEDDGFDLVVAISVFEHISDLKQIVERVNSLLRPAGHLLVGMPRVDKFMEKAFCFVGYSGIKNHHVSNHKDFFKEACASLNLVDINHMPQILPRSLGLYFAMLFEKKLDHMATQH